jgi:hypothetical protein
MCGINIIYICLVAFILGSHSKVISETLFISLYFMFNLSFHGGEHKASKDG